MCQLATLSRTDHSGRREVGLGVVGGSSPESGDPITVPHAFWAQLFLGGSLLDDGPQGVIAARGEALGVEADGLLPSPPRFHDRSLEGGAFSRNRHGLTHGWKEVVVLVCENGGSNVLVTSVSAGLSVAQEGASRDHLGNKSPSSEGGKRKRPLSLK